MPLVHIPSPVRLTLLPNSLAHHPVQDAHVEVCRGIAYALSLQGLEAESVPKPVQLDKGLVNGSDPKLLVPHSGPVTDGGRLLEAVDVKSSNAVSIQHSRRP